MTDTRWMTYDELAHALRITPASARRLVARRKWHRKAGNDGKARIEVPAERLAPDNPLDDRGDVTPDAAPDDTPDVRGDFMTVLKVLNRHIERLERDLETARGECEAERARANELMLKAAQVDALNAVIEAERKRTDDLRQDRDRWAAEAERLAMPPARERRGLFGWRKRA